MRTKTQPDASKPAAGPHITVFAVKDGAGRIVSATGTGTDGVRHRGRSDSQVVERVRASAGRHAVLLREHEENPNDVEGWEKVRDDVLEGL